MNIWRELDVVRQAWETLRHSSEAAEVQETARLAKIISQYEHAMTDENAAPIIEAANRHRWRMADADGEAKIGLQMKYFVLKPKGEDVCAVASRRAMRAYALTVRRTNPQFAHNGKRLAAIGEALNADLDDVPQ
jgi:hypothetical protein